MPYKEYFTYLRLSALKHLQMKTDEVLWQYNAAQSVKLDFGFAPHAVLSLTGLLYKDTVAQLVKKSRLF
jgi:hypothetical protein